MDRIRIDQIVTDRDVDAAEPLPSDPLIVRVPIVVTQDRVLIDGLRRVKYWRDCGAKSIAAIIVHNFDEIEAALTPQHVGRKLTPRQMWNILHIIYPIGLDESKKRRAIEGQETRQTGRTPRIRSEVGSLRSRLVTMFDLRSGHSVERTLYLYRHAAAGNELAQQLVAEVDAGTKGIYGACGEFDEKLKKPSTNIRDVTEQKTLLENGSRNLRAQVSTLWKVGSPILVDPTDLDTYIQSLAASKKNLTAFIKALKEAHTERSHG